MSPTAGIEGIRFVPDVPSGTGALVLGGSSGRIDAPRARLLADEGVLAESVRWFGGPGQHDGPWEVPLETSLVSDPAAGHRAILPGEPVVTAGMRMQRGGTEEADRRLGSAAWTAIKALLR